MPGKSPEFREFIERVSNDLRSGDEEAKAKFFEAFGDDLEGYTSATGTALGLWNRFRDDIPEDDSRRVAVAGITFTAINSHMASLKLFMAGYAVASRSLFRLVLEGTSLAALCSVKTLDVLDRYMADQYSTNNAVMDLVRHQEVARLRADAVEVVSSQYKDYHKYAHLTIETIIAGANLSAGGVPHVGAFFDPARLSEYGREFRSRLSFSRMLPNFIMGVVRNVAEW